ncbi:MAG TPA: sensor histidine kinase [Thermoanaerobaculia bacterium]|nr:sensor histidine kinase [Thermoanaerobaculia bacterium]
MPGDVPRVAALAASALALGGLLATSLGARLLGAFAAPLRLLVPLALTLVALAKTGGVTSDLFPLLVVTLAAEAAISREGGRFLLVGTYAGLALLVVLDPAPTAPAARSIAMHFLWPAAAVLGMEVVLPRKRPGRDSGAEDAPAPARPVAQRTPATPAPGRDPRSEILHDLKSPLTVLRVYGDLIGEAARRGELPSEAHLLGLGREITLMESLAGISPRAPAPAPAASPSAMSAAPPVPRSDLVRVLSTLVESYRLAHGERVRLEFVAEGAEIPVAADPVALQRAFRNVLDNAVKYTPAGGQVRVRASVVAQHAFVVISDTGAGMTPEEQKHAFTFAWRSPSASASGVPGRGIGLGVTKDLLEKNGGKISLLSEPGHGLEVTIMFPVAREAGA